MCPVNDAKKAATQDCLDKHVLRRTDGGGVRYPVPKGKYNAFFNYTVQLPPDLTCKQCVVQWKYRTGQPALRSLSLSHTHTHTHMDSELIREKLTLQ